MKHTKMKEKQEVGFKKSQIFSTASFLWGLFLQLNMDKNTVHTIPKIQGD